MEQYKVIGDSICQFQQQRKKSYKLSKESYQNLISFYEEIFDTNEDLRQMLFDLLVIKDSSDDRNPTIYTNHPECNLVGGIRLARQPVNPPVLAYLTDLYDRLKDKTIGDMKNEEIKLFREVKELIPYRAYGEKRIIIAIELNHRVGAGKYLLGEKLKNKFPTLAQFFCNGKLSDLERYYD